MSWQQAHEELIRLATERAGLGFEEGRALLRARRAGAHLRLGFASFNEYTERLFGYGDVVGAAAADVRTKAFQALRALGFREGDAERALAKIPNTVSSLEQLVRQALRELGPQ